MILIIFQNIVLAHGKDRRVNNQIAHYENKFKYETDSWDLYEGLSNNQNIVIVDTRSPEAFELEHIPSSINITHRTMSEESTKDRNKSTTIYFLRPIV